MNASESSGYSRAAPQMPGDPKDSPQHHCGHPSPATQDQQSLRYPRRDQYVLTYLVINSMGTAM